MTIASLKDSRNIGGLIGGSSKDSETNASLCSF